MNRHGFSKSDIVVHRRTGRKHKVSAVKKYYIRLINAGWELSKTCMPYTKICPGDKVKITRSFTRFGVKLREGDEALVTFVVDNQSYQHIEVEGLKGFVSGYSFEPIPGKHKIREKVELI